MNRIIGLSFIVILISSIFVINVDFAYGSLINSQPTTLSVTNSILENFTIKKFSNQTISWQKPIPIITNKTSNFNILNSTQQSLPIGTVTTLNLTGINRDSIIESSSIDLVVDGNSSKKCVLKLKDDVINPVTISNNFSCFGIQHIILNQWGKDAIKNNLSIKIVNFAVRDQNNNTVQFISSNATILYKQPTYFAKVVNGTVKQIIVADKSFVDTLQGTWIETKQDGSIRGNFAGIGYSYNSTKDQFIPPQPFPSWILNSTAQWNAPISHPNNGHVYTWDEANKKWVMLI